MKNNNMNKEELNQEIGKLKASLEAHESQVKDLQQDLQVAEKKLADSNKPKLTIEQLNAIENAISCAIRSYNGLNEEDRYDYEMAMEYDNKIYLSHIEFNDTDDLANEVYANVEDLFGIDESDDTDSVPSE
tara:strand:+ start:180 stop:572 length:393 start_codon:yes stop_codon:yes gene_type:complete